MVLSLSAEEDGEVERSNDASLTTGRRRGGSRRKLALGAWVDRGGQAPLRRRRNRGRAGRRGLRRRRAGRRGGGGGAGAKGASGIGEERSERDWGRRACTAIGGWRLGFHRGGFTFITHVGKKSTALIKSISVGRPRWSEL